MPPGYKPNVNADNVNLPFGIDPEDATLALSMLGTGLDVAEMLSTIPAPQIAAFLAWIDAGVTGAACYTAGECYINQPHPDLPTMIVINQDVAVNALDAILVGAIPDTPIETVADASLTVTKRQVVDTVTSYASFIYDNFDATGFIPNHVSFGVGYDQVTNDLGFYIIVYQAELGK
jgi:hypothetical protein